MYYITTHTMSHLAIKSSPLFACIIVCFLFVSACSTDSVRSSADAVALPALVPMLLWQLDEMRGQRETEKYQQLLDDEYNIYNGMSQQQILNKVGDPVAVYACHSHTSSAHYKLWEYLDERFSYNFKYLMFGINNEIRTVDDQPPYKLITPYSTDGCCAFLNDLVDIEQLTFDNICNAQLKLSMVQSELSDMEYAVRALLRGDMEATYRLLEDGLTVENAGVVGRTRKLIEQNPNILRGAKSSFSKRSLKESFGVYGMDAVSLENERLSIYVTIAPTEDYKKAQQNYEEIFGSAR